MSQAAVMREDTRRAIGREAVLEAGAADPAWLRARRDEAWEIYEATPLPSTRSEEWRYTDVARLLPIDELEPVGGGAAGGAALPGRLRRAMDQDRESAGRIVDMDGRVVSVELDETLAEQGVVLSSLRDAARRGVPEVEALLATRAVPASEGKFPAAQRRTVERRGLPVRPPRGARRPDHTA